MERTLVMGVLNLTPDSFSDGGRFVSSEGQADDVDAAVRAALDMVAEGADIVDLGGESTRPGSEPTPPSEEQRRVLPVLRRLLDELGQGPEGGTVLSLDTRRAQTARSALELAQQAGRGEELIINDVSGLLTEPELPEVIAEYGAQIVITHNRGDSKTMQSQTEYDDVVAEVLAELGQIRRLYLEAGVAPERIIIDPGIGFAKTHEQNWQLIAGLDRIVAEGHRVLFGVSRKGFLGPLLAAEDGTPRPAERRDAATAALSTAASFAGAWAVRVHDVGPNADAVRVVERIRSLSLGPG